MDNEGMRGKMSEAAQYELIELLCRMMPGGIIGIYIEKGFPLYVINDTMLQMLGYTYDEFVERTGGMMLNAVCAADRDIVQALLSARVKWEKQLAVEYRIIRKDGSFLWVHDVGRKLTMEDGRQVIISVLVDISDSRKMRDRLMEEAEKDYLTGVFNRKGGEILISRHMQKDVPYIFLMFDLDNFKDVNDLYGHNEGDIMLRFMGGLLKRSFRASDFVIRLGGDEFALFAQPCHSPEAVSEIAERIIRSYEEEAGRRYPLVSTSVSIGGIYRTQERTFSELYKMADRILYGIKRNGKGRCEILQEQE